MSGYTQLVERLKEISDIGHISSLLGWDQQTYMPPGGHHDRSRQISLLSGLAHEKQIDPRLGELLDECARDDGLDDAGKALVREAAHDRNLAVKVPTDLVRTISRTAAEAHAVWAKARAENSFATFAPLLQKLVDLKRQEAEHLGYPADGVPYDALLDQFEPGATVKKLTPVIEATRDIVVPAVRALTSASVTPDISLLQRGYAAAGQEAFGRIAMEAMGYDTDRGRLDVSVHPFTTSFGSGDVRITTRYEEDWLPGSVFGTIHEAGHALYEQGLPPEHYGTPLGEARSLGIHESQSRFWENYIGRSLPFWQRFYPDMQRIFPEILGSVPLEEFHLAVNAVRPSLIRVEADEVTYNLHIVVRYEIEQALFDGSVAVADLPGLWNDKMEAYLGIRPDTDAEGILQDIHWSFGGFGYFPTYLLGNLYAAQWMHTLRGAMPDLDAKIAAGDLLPIREWLRNNIHIHGRRYTTDELAVRVSGETLNPRYFDTYLRERFGALYQVSW